MNLRGTSGEVKIFQDKELLGKRDAPAGYYELHRDAIYYFNKCPYRVNSITTTEDGAKVSLYPSNEENKRTIPIVKTYITNKTVEKTKDVESELKPITLLYGTIDIDRTIVGYYKGDFNKPIEELKIFKGENVPSWENFNWKSTNMAIGIVLPSEFIKSIPDAENSISTDDPGIHTIVHVFMNAAKIVAKTEANEIDACYDDGKIYIYDNTANGVNGCSKIIYENFEKVLDICRKLLDECNCDKGLIKDGQELGGDGCPRCTFTTGFCETRNKQLSKQTARGFFGVL